MLKIGLTGGIGCGKSTVANIFQHLKVPVIDADDISHQLVAVGQPALALIELEYGPGILNTDGSLNRIRLRKLIFSDLQQKQKLEAILHPLVYQAIQAELKQLTAPYCIIGIPLLFETKMTHLVDRTLVVDCPVETQLERLQKRDAMSIASIQAIIDSQVSRAFRKAHADDLIDNSKTDDRLAEAVKKLHNFYLSLSTCQEKRVCE
ncbi:MAG: dephospho-CoA kinase [Methylococcaceae bacterium]|jgi:dephospho-CoA kinase